MTPRESLDKLPFGTATEIMNQLSSDGFVIVPIEPTKTMIQASFDSMKPYKRNELSKGKKVKSRWAAMLAAVYP